MKDFIIIISFILVFILFLFLGNRLQKIERFTLLCNPQGNLFAPEAAPDGTVLTTNNYKECDSQKVVISFNDKGERVLTCSPTGETLTDNGKQTTNVKFCQSNKANLITLSNNRPSTWELESPENKMAELKLNQTPYFQCQENGECSGNGLPIGSETTNANQCQSLRAQQYNINGSEKLICDPYGLYFAPGKAPNGVLVKNTEGCASGQSVSLGNGIFRCGPGTGNEITISVPDGAETDDPQKCLCQRAIVKPPPPPPPPQSTFNKMRNFKLF